MLSTKNKWKKDIQTFARTNQNRMSTVTKRNVEEQVDVSESGRKWQTSNRAEYGEEHKENKRIRCITNLFVKSYVKRQEEDEYDQIISYGIDPSTRTWKRWETKNGKIDRVNNCQVQERSKLESSQKKWNKEYSELLEQIHRRANLRERSRTDFERNTKNWKKKAGLQGIFCGSVKWLNGVNADLQCRKGTWKRSVRKSWTVEYE